MAGHADPVASGAKQDAPPTRVLVVIGDLVKSRQVADRSGLQARFVDAVGDCNASLSDVLSPYTVTLGDEFQVVLASATRVFVDLTTIAAALLGAPDAPSHDAASTSIRFSLAVGELSTPLNPDQAIGMDGPAFHAARSGIEELKRSGDSFTLSGIDPGSDELCNSAFALISHAMAGWNARRHWILAERMQKTDVASIAEHVGISTAAVYKNLTQGGVDVVCRNLLAVGQIIDSALQAPPSP